MCIWLQSWCWYSDYDLCMYVEGPGNNESIIIMQIVIIKI